MDVNARLKAACRVGDIDEIEKCLAQGADVNHIDTSAQKENVTGLWLAAESGKLDAVELLLARKSNINFKRKKDGASVLYVACQNGHADVVAHILNTKGFKGVDVAKTNGNTPLLIASQQGYPQIARLLLAHGADTNARNETNVTAFMLACFTGNAELAVLLLEAGSDPAQKGGGKTGIEWAVARGNKKVVAAVHHYMKIVSKMTLSDPFVQGLFYEWLAVGTARANRPATPSVHTESSMGEATGDLDFPEYEPIRLPTDSNGERLRRPPAPAMLRSGADAGARGDGKHSTALGTAVGSAAGGSDVAESTIQRLPSLPGDARYPENEDGGAAGPTTSVHKFLRQLETAYEGEFGGAEKKMDWRQAMVADVANARRAEMRRSAARTPPAQTTATTPLSARRGAAATTPSRRPKAERTRVVVDSCFRALFPDRDERGAVKAKYEEQHVLLSRVHRSAAVEGAQRRDPPRAGGNPVLLSGIHHTRKVNEHANMRTGRHTHASELERAWARKSRRNIEDAQMRAQKEAEKRAVRAATALAVTSKIEKQVLSGEVHDPVLRARINRDECSTVPMAKVRDVACRQGYQQFHAKYSTIPGEF